MLQWIYTAGEVDHHLTDGGWHPLSTTCTLIKTFVQATTGASAVTGRGGRAVVNRRSSVPVLTLPSQPKDPPLSDTRTTIMWGQARNLLGTTTPEEIMGLIQKKGRIVLLLKRIPTVTPYQTKIATVSSHLTCPAVTEKIHCLRKHFREDISKMP